jgi:hypothetical protein
MVGGPQKVSQIAPPKIRGLQSVRFAELHNCGNVDLRFKDPRFFADFNFRKSANTYFSPYKYSK